MDLKENPHYTTLQKASQRLLSSLDANPIQFKTVWSTSPGRNRDVDDQTSTGISRSGQKLPQSKPRPTLDSSNP